MTITICDAKIGDIVKIPIYDKNGNIITQDFVIKNIAKCDPIVIHAFNGNKLYSLIKTGQDKYSTEYWTNVDMLYFVANASENFCKLLYELEWIETNSDGEKINKILKRTFEFYITGKYDKSIV